MKTHGLLLNVVAVGSICLLACGCGRSNANDFQSFESSDLVELAQQSSAEKTGNPAESIETDQQPDLNSETTTTQKSESDINKLTDDPTRSVDPELDPISANAVASADTLKQNPHTKKSQPPKGGIKLLIPEKTFRVEGPEKALRISYDDFDLLKILNMDPVPVDAKKHMPKWLKQLDGKRIRVRGFMYPPFEETGLRGFVLARDNQICCFGRNPKIYDLVEVTMGKGKTANYIQNRPFDVIGVFHIDPVEEDGELFALYRIDDAVVIDK